MRLQYAVLVHDRLVADFDEVELDQAGRMEVRAPPDPGPEQSEIPGQKRCALQQIER